MTHRTKMPRWMHAAELVDADEWVAAPTRAQTVCRIVTERDGRLPDLHALSTWRYRLLGRPLLWLTDRAIGQNLGRLIQIGAYIVAEGPEESFDKDEAVAELHAEHALARDKVRELRGRLADAERDANAGKNLARALRRLDGLIDEKGRDLR